MASLCSRYSAPTDWVIRGQFSAVISTGFQRQGKQPYDKQLINLKRSVRENLKPRSSRIDLTDLVIARLIRQGLIT